jgi:hypothetical protein
MRRTSIADRLLFSVADAAWYAGITPDDIMKLVEDREIASFTFCGKLVIGAASLRRLIARTSDRARRDAEVRSATKKPCGARPEGAR